MNILFIGGTGNISSSCTRLAPEHGHSLTLLNRGMAAPRPVPDSVERIRADINDLAQVREALGDRVWDSVVDWRIFTPEQAEQAIDLFRGRTRQFVFISSASVYCTPPNHPVITESTPLGNPYWEYSRNKIACEERFLRAWREEAFPVTIIRPSHTYDIAIPVAAGHWDYSVVRRMRAGKPMIVPGDGTSLWTVTHAQDFARGFLPLLAHPQTLGEAIHITSDESLTWNQIMQIVGEVFECAPNIVHIPSELVYRLDPHDLGPGLMGDKAHSVIFDNTKLKTLVPGFRATIPFHEGLRLTRDWFEADPARQQPHPTSEQSDALQDRIAACWTAAMDALGDETA